MGAVSDNVGRRKLKARPTVAVTSLHPTIMAPTRLDFEPARATLSCATHFQTTD